MRPVLYSINVTLDGCCDHRVGIPTEGLHRNAMENIQRADVLVLGRVIYEMMEAAWRLPKPAGTWPEWMMGFAKAIDAAKKYVASDTLASVDWNAELVRSAQLVETVERLRREPGNGIMVGGVRLPAALARHGLIDEYELVVHPRIAGHGPRLLDGIPQLIDLRLVGTTDLGEGVVAMKYVPR